MICLLTSILILKLFLLRKEIHDYTEVRLEKIYCFTILGQLAKVYNYFFTVNLNTYV